MRDVTRLVQQATSQQGLLTSRQARAIGISSHVLRRLCAAGLLVRIERGTYRLSTHPPTWLQYLAAACWTADPPAVASHRSALRLWGLRTVDEDLEVTVRHPRKHRAGSVIVHRSVDLEPCDVTWVDGIPTTTPVRSLGDAGLVFPEHEVRRMVDHSVATGLVSVADLWRFRRRVGRQGRNGVGALHAALEGLPAGAASVESGLELALLRLCAAHGLPPPVVQHPIVVGGVRFRADFAYPEERVLVEIDGFAVHSQPDRFVADRRRQNALIIAGWKVVRFTYQDLRDRPLGVIAQIGAAIGVL